MLRSPIIARLRETVSASEVVRVLDYDDGQGSETRTLYWKVTGPVLPGKLQTHDLAAVALVFEAMRAGRPLHIKGPVTWRVLANLADFQAAFSQWRPHAYQRVAITADEVVRSEAVAPQKSVALFSGGVDATYTIWRHHLNGAGDAARPIATALLIHGFDIPLAKHEAFAVAATQARNTLNSANLPLTTMETNWKDVACGEWEMEFGAGLAGCLHQFHPDAGSGLVGSDEDYRSLALSIVLPWGSNPVTAPLLSGDNFEIRYDGADATRTEKVSSLARGWPAAAEQLRVCWEGAITGRNCGVCEKCIRTKLNFLACGERPPSGLGALPTNAEISSLRARNAVQLSYLEDIMRSASGRGITGSWVDALSRLLKKRRLEISAKKFVQAVPGGRPLLKSAKALLG